MAVRHLTRFQVSLPPEHMQILKQMAVQDSRSVAAIVRLIVADFIKRHEKEGN